MIVTFSQQTPVIIAGNKEQQKKYLGRLIEEPLLTVSIAVVTSELHGAESLRT
jgi:methyl coenzyme M reductase subunit C-like uncharacterized protein (methanogenesis marker protein 7)